MIPARSVQPLTKMPQRPWKLCSAGPFSGSLSRDRCRRAELPVVGVVGKRACEPQRDPSGTPLAPPASPYSRSLSKRPDRGMGEPCDVLITADNSGLWSIAAANIRRGRAATSELQHRVVAEARGVVAIRAAHHAIEKHKMTKQLGRAVRHLLGKALPKEIAVSRTPITARGIRPRSGRREVLPTARADAQRGPCGVVACAQTILRAIIRAARCASPAPSRS